MIPNNNLSILPWYRSVDAQNARKWWVYGRVYPLFTQAGFMPPFQLACPVDDWGGGFLAMSIFDYNTDAVVATIPNITFRNAGGFTKLIDGIVYLVYPGLLPLVNSMPNGRYYAVINGDLENFYSDVFTVVNDIQPYLKLKWWDAEDFVMDAGAIVYENPFKNFIYLDADIAKPEYIFEEEGETRDGYFFPVKLISEKRYRFSFLAPEYLLDVLRFVRMADYIEIEYHGQRYSLDTFLITPEWTDNGDIATVQAEFDTATVAKKIGLGYIRAQRGDFNDDFNNDYDNE